MRLAILATVTVASSLLGLCRGDAQLEVIDGGSCQTFPDLGGTTEKDLCSMLRGKRMWLFQGLDFAERSENLYNELSFILNAATSVANSKCTGDFIATLCESYFPPCTGDMPALPCKSACDLLYTKEWCYDTFDLAAAAGITDRVLKCNKVIGDPLTVRDYSIPKYFSWWDGKPYFQTETYQDKDPATGMDVSVKCKELPSQRKGSDATSTCRRKNCAEPLLPRFFPVVTDRQSSLALDKPENVAYCREQQEEDSTLDCDNCTQDCVFACPYEMLYDSSEWNLMWVCNFLPGALGMPIAALVFYSEKKKLANMKKANLTDYYMLWASFLCILFSLIDSFPSMIFKQKMRCGDDDNLNAATNMDQTTMQKIGQIKPFILMSLMYTVACTLYKVRKQLIASRTMQKYTPGASAKQGAVCGMIGIPLASFLACMVARPDIWYISDNIYREAHNGTITEKTLVIPNSIRYMYTSGPILSTATEELVLVQVPVLFAGFLCLVISAQLLTIVGAMQAQSSSAGKKNETVQKLAKSMLRFAAVSLFCVMLNALAVAVYLPKATELGSMMGKFSRCAVGGIPAQYFNDSDGSILSVYNNQPVVLSEITIKGKDLNSTLTNCGNPRDFVPNPVVLYLLLLAQSLPFLLFGLVFALPAIKQLRESVSKSFSKVSASAASSSSG